MQVRRVFTEDELYPPPAPLIYEGDGLNEIAFPLGGIGTGCVSLSGRGALVDWEIFNRPNKGTILPYTFFALWARAEGDEPITRVVQAPPRPPFSGQSGGMYRGFGFGVTREDGSGLPHMRSARLRGEFPFAEIDFDEPDLPVSVRLEAYSPFIPLNADDSGLPIAVLRYHVRNETDRPVQVSLAGNIFNPVGYAGSGPFTSGRDSGALGGNINRFVDEGAVRGLVLGTEKYAPGHPAYGSMALTTTWPEVFHQCAWLRGAWYDAMHDYWDHYSADGVLPERDYGPSAAGQSDVGTLGLRVTLNPGESAVLPFFITWHFPTFTKYWGTHDSGDCACEPATWSNYYASQWDDALDIARYYAAHEERLYADTRLFHDTLFDSTLPPYVLDALSSQASILHSPTVLRLPDGTFYGFEGCHTDSGCCEGSCTHVWNYAQTVAFLFPALERSLRDADYVYNLRDDGHMAFRLQLPLGSPMWEYHAAADGQLGGILKVYRDWLLCGDDNWLHWLWPRLKKALAYAWQQWDPDRDGVIDGVQHNTYDIEFYGANSMIGSLYLGALRAAEEMARHLGDTETADEYARVYARGRARVENELYNGEYYVQKYDPTLAPKYQYGEGCLSDQLIGQWLAHIVGLEHILDADQVRSAIHAVYAHNWRADFWNHANPQRIYALNDEQGLLLCTWPRGGRPALPFVYSDEVWCGIEYQVAGHLIYEGYVEEGLAIVKGLRARHDGRRRNPWNEFECGSHYARSLASWGVLTALSGYRFDVPRRTLGFSPRLRADDWRSFWSLDSGWGSYSQRLGEKSGDVALRVMRGRVELDCLNLGSVRGAPRIEASVGSRPVPVDSVSGESGLSLRFASTVRLKEGEALHVVLIW